VGVKVGTHRIARLANRMGLHTKVSTNLAITLGGLKEGLSPLEMAYAYSTIANEGKRVTGPLAAWKNGPVAIEDVKTAGGKHIYRYKRKAIQVIPPAVAQEAKLVMEGVVTHGTGTAAQLGANEVVAGKTGTTENYGDAWFVGFDDKYTVAVWVGYPDKLIPMKTQYRGGPVEGGTYPAQIWHDFMASVLSILNERNPKKNPDTATPGAAPSPYDTAPATSSGGTTTPQQTPQTNGGGGNQKTAPKQQQTPQQQQPPAQQTPPTQTPAPTGGGGTGGAGAPPTTP
jgi:penicillin-binding protein 1A